MKKFLLFFVVVLVVSTLSISCVNAQDDEGISRVSLGPADGQGEGEEFVLKSFPGNPSTDFYEGRRRIWIKTISGGEIRMRSNGKPGEAVNEWETIWDTYPPTFWKKGDVQVVWRLDD